MCSPRFCAPCLDVQGLYLLQVFNICVGVRVLSARVAEFRCVCAASRARSNARPEVLDQQLFPFRVASSCPSIPKLYPPLSLALGLYFRVERYVNGLSSHFPSLCAFTYGLLLLAF